MLGGDHLKSVGDQGSTAPLSHADFVVYDENPGRTFHPFLSTEK